VSKKDGDRTNKNGLKEKLTFNTFISIFNILIPFYKSPPPGEHNEVNRVRAGDGVDT
jgi:hypothetical protein